MNWIIPGKFLAFSGPSATTKDPDGWRTFTPEDYAPIFKGIGITHIIRLNKEIYDRTVYLVSSYFTAFHEERFPPH